MKLNNCLVKYAFTKLTSSNRVSKRKRLVSDIGRQTVPRDGKENAL